MRWCRTTRPSLPFHSPHPTKVFNGLVARTCMSNQGHVYAICPRPATKIFPSISPADACSKTGRPWRRLTWASVHTTRILILRRGRRATRLGRKHIGWAGRLQVGLGKRVAWMFAWMSGGQVIWPQRMHSGCLKDVMTRWSCFWLNQPLIRRTQEVRNRC